MIKIKNVPGKIKNGEYILGGHFVYSDGEKIGRVCKFCCGIDYLPDAAKGMFSILKINNYSDPKLKTCIKALETIKYPKKDFHWNFQYKIAKDKDAMAKYKTDLEALSKRKKLADISI